MEVSYPTELFGPGKKFTCLKQVMLRSERRRFDIKRAKGVFLAELLAVKIFAAAELSLLFQLPYFQLHQTHYPP
jgi:hypothetical protein